MNRSKTIPSPKTLGIKRQETLAKYGIQATETTLTLGKHNYCSDFPLLDQNTEIEAIRLNIYLYRKRND